MPGSFADGKLRTDRPRPGFASFRPYRIKRALLGGACAAGLVVALAMGSSPAAARAKVKYKSGHKETEHVSKEPFGDIPKGPLQILISIDQQKLYLYSDGTLVADAPVATGVPSHPTPLGVFNVISKDRFHRSNIYSNAPMPYMQRITWSGVAMHEGVGVGHPASHGCIRMPHDFAARLWVLTKLGASVIIARDELKPVGFADSHLFAHKDMPPGPAVAKADAVKTAQSVDAGKTTDAVVAVADSSDAARAAKPAEPDAVRVDAQKDPAAGPVAALVADSAPVTDSATGTEPAKLVPAGPETPPPPTATNAETPASTIDPDEMMPLPLAKPTALMETAAAAHAPIAIFVSRKTKRIYVRQHFSPLFAAPVTIDQPDRPLGTHVFTAMEYLDNGSTFRWNVVSLPGEQPRAARRADDGARSGRHGKGKRRDEALDRPIAEPQPSPTPQQALARIEIPQDVIDQISELMVPGSSLVVSDQGLGDETGEGTNFIVITH